MIEKKPYRVHLCCGPTCSQFGPKALLAALEDEVRALGLEDQVSIQLSACRNRCEQSPSLNVYPGPVMYNRLTPAAVRQIVRQHLSGGEPVQEWLFQPGQPVGTGARQQPGEQEPGRQEAKSRWRWW